MGEVAERSHDTGERAASAPGLDQTVVGWVAAALVVVCGSLLVVAAAADALLEQDGVTARDPMRLAWFVDHRSAAAVGVARVVTWLGSAPVIAAVCAMAFVVLWRRGLALVEAAAAFALIREYSITPSHYVEVQPTGRLLGFNNSNRLVNSGEWDIRLQKTGYIREAGRCLVMLVQIASKPVVIDADGTETIAIRSMMFLALSYDHRIVDGADAARFLSTVKERLEEGRFEASLGL